jgi:hypothetical protein
MFQLVTCPILVLILTSAAIAQPSETKVMTPDWILAVLRDWSEQDASYALAKLEQGTPEEIAQRYVELAQHLYNDKKDIAGMLVASRAGIDFCLRRAKELSATDEKLATTLRGKGKAIAYNLGANCWPGWKDPGVTLGPVERAIGLDAARLNLRLGIELQRPAEPLGHAHWLLGAQWLAASKPEQAAAEFRLSAGKFKEANKPTEQQMAVVYEQLANRLADTKNAAQQKSLQAALAELEALNNDDARFFAAQARTAEEVFLAP